MKMYSPEKLAGAIADGRDIQIVDVRETYEVEAGAISDCHIPMGDVLARLDEIRRDVPVVVYCRSGKRAAAVVYLLTERFHLYNLHVLEGGVEAYAKAINPEISVYA